MRASFDICKINFWSSKLYFITRNKKEQQKWTSAITPIHPAIIAAFACAPLIPPNPDVTKSIPPRFFTPRYLRPAFMIVI